MRTHLHLFISRVAFICNVLFLYCLLVRHTKDFLVNQDVNSVIIILGWGVAFFLNIFLTFFWFFILVTKKSSDIPVWLNASNALVFLVQIIVLLF